MVIHKFNSRYLEFKRMPLRVMQKNAKIRLAGNKCPASAGRRSKGFFEGAR
jgi:hypothetical protein